MLHKSRGMSAVYFIVSRYCDSHELIKSFFINNLNLLNRYCELFLLRCINLKWENKRIGADIILTLLLFFVPV